MYEKEKVLGYWNEQVVESMYDKHLLGCEVALIRRQIADNSRILDAGCGEGEGTIVYSSIPGASVVAADFSETRLAMAKTRLASRRNVTFTRADLSEVYEVGREFDFVVSQRMLINITEWSLQQKVLRGFTVRLKIGGRLLLLEGSVDGVEELNRFRDLLGLPPLPVRWHNLFLSDAKLEEFMNASGTKLVEKTGLGAYFLLTRGVRPCFDATLDWDTEFNRRAAGDTIEKTLEMGCRCSRLRLWVFERCR
jgi:ubiquinone/menaquinone biosynthesis C-methylase UbiE